MEKRGYKIMKQEIRVKPVGVQIRTFKAEVDVIAKNIITGNLIIKSFKDTYKELEFSENEQCWIIKGESQELPTINGKTEWRRVVKGVPDETNIHPTISIKNALSRLVGKRISEKI